MRDDGCANFGYGSVAYGREPFDLRLAVLCMLRKLPVLIAGTVLGMVVFGGGYYVRHVLLRGERLYAASSTYRVEYAVQEEKDVGTVHINQMSWNTYMRSQMFLEAVEGHLIETAQGAQVPGKEEVGEALEAFLASDLRVPSTTVTTDSPEKSLWIAGAVEAAMTGELAGAVREIVSISVISPAESAHEVIPDVRPARAFALSGVLSCFFTAVVLLLCITGDDAVRLPAIVWKRYGVRAAGTMESRELAENIRYFFRDGALRAESGKLSGCAAVSPEQDGKCGGKLLRNVAVRQEQDVADGGKLSGCAAVSQEQDVADGGKILGNVAVCPVQAGIDGREVLEKLCTVCAEVREMAEGGRWFAVPSPLAEPEACRRLREAEGILLVLGAGSHGGRQLEHVLEYLRQQDCPVTAVLLWGADERLVRWYYLSGGKGGR